MIETSYAIPVYRGWPERDYKVVGSIRFEDAWENWDDGIIAMAASTGKARKGDAIIIRQGAEFGVGGIAGVPNASTTYSPNQTTALVIRWLTREELQARNAAKEEFLRQYRLDYPNVNGSSEVEDIAYLHFARESGGDPKSREVATRFAEALEKISRRTEGSLTGMWVYKGTLLSGSVTSSGNENVVLGIATVKVDGESIVIVSHSGKSEINFNGTYVKGRVNGQIGIDSLSTKCEGAAVDTKISLSFQSLTSDGTVRGSLVFQR